MVALLGAIGDKLARMEFLAAIEHTAFSVWIRESSWALFAFLIVHTISMGFVVGAAIALAVRAWVVASNSSLSSMAGLLPLAKVALATAVASGLLLAFGYPTKAVTNPVFYLKLSLLAGALLASRMLWRRGLMNSSQAVDEQASRTRMLATVNVLLWIATLAAGKFLAYTYRILLAD